MTPDQILALQPGPELDQAIHVNVFGGIGRCAKYSTSDAAGLKILNTLPLFVGRVDPAHPKADVSRPFVAGTLAHEPSLSGDVTRLRVTAATRMSALCKAALLVVLRPAKAERPAPRQSSEDAARALAAKVGTPAARHPTMRLPQPTARVHARDQRLPMPTRPQHFIGPTPQAAPGRPNA